MIHIPDLMKFVNHTSAGNDSVISAYMAAMKLVPFSWYCLLFIKNSWPIRALEMRLKTERCFLCGIFVQFYPHAD